MKRKSVRQVMIELRKEQINTWFDLCLFLDRIKDGRPEPAAASFKTLDAFKSHPEKRLKTAGVMELTGLPRRTVQYALMTLKEKGFLQLLGKGRGSRYQLVF